MRCANAARFHRKSGGAKPRDLRFRGPLLEMLFACCLYLKNSVGNPGAEAMRRQRTILEVEPVLVFIIDRPNRKAMEVNIKPASGSEQKVPAVAITERE